ncbi:MAG: FtsX-like permease family protein [Oscillospiraceae bacterium]|nr:FtsX-like permease family protein [Oscillospiraceae bacterium]
MLFKISVNNIRKSLRDYAIYFFTLIIGVSIFYVFNAINTQTAFLAVSQDIRQMLEFLNVLLSGVSVFVSIVLGLLIVYASRFLMKRRNKEFALYLILGMSKGKISAILIVETIIIGTGSLVAGLFAGIGISQLMSAVVANLFEADMTDYRFTISVEAIIKTIIYFGIMYVVVMVFNSIMIGRCKLIDLMQSGKKSEKMKLKNPVLCTIIFIIAAIGLGYAYYRVAFKNNDMNNKLIISMIILGSVTTFLIFWSVSGLLLHIVTSAKNVYFRSLNSFTFRQISSKINTTVMSVTVINLMLFVTICTLSSAFSVRNSMNANLNGLCPADFIIQYYVRSDREGYDNAPKDIVQAYEKHGYDITAYFSEYVHLSEYYTEELTMGDFCGDKLDEIKEKFIYLDYDYQEDIVKLSDYNRLMELYGREKLELEDDEYILVSNFKPMKEFRDSVLAEGKPLTIFGKTLKPKYSETQDGFLELAAQYINTGIFIVPDYVVDDSPSAINYLDYFIGNYNAKTKEEKAAVEEMVLEIYSKARKDISDDWGIEYSMTSVNTRIDIANATIGLGAMAALLGLYIGLVFLISCGAILALKELSECADSVQRYNILRKIGTEERDISRSLFRQMGIFFLLPLLLACVHSIFGMKFALLILEEFGTEKMAESIIFTAVMVAIIYGGYFLITYFCGKSIIRDKQG